MRTVFVSLMLAAGASACTAVSSSNIDTSGIKASLSVQADDTGEISVEAILMDGSNYVTLGGGDSLSVAVSGTSGSTPLGKSTAAFGQVDYTATLASGATGPFTIAFGRPSGKVSAPLSTVSLPPVFSLVSPSTGGPISLSSTGIPLQWSVAPIANELMYWSASGSCITPVSNAEITLVPGEDETVYTIPPGTLKMAASNGTSPESSTIGSCAVTISVVGELTGAADPAFESGSTIVGIRAPPGISVQVTQ